VQQTGILEDLYQRVISRGLCAACGACVGQCPYLIKFKGKTVKLDSCARSEGRCYTYCPVASFDTEVVAQAVFGLPYEADGLGNLIEVRASRSTADDVVSIAQGGGTVTSLMIMALEEDLIDAAVLTLPDGPDGFPCGVVATTPEEIKACAGSKFIGGHSLQALREALDKGFQRIGVVAVPCQARSVRKMQVYDLKNENLRNRIPMLVGLFCNWTFSAREFTSLLSGLIGEREIKKYDIPPPPANILKVETTDGVESISLDELRPLIQAACHSCPDMTSEFADISVGMFEGRPGWNTLIVRTQAGMELIRMAREKQILQTEPFPERNLAHLTRASLNKRERVSA
jgi:coenzyme F420 hydrogenase subunit beta